MQRNKLKKFFAVFLLIASMFMMTAGYETGDRVDLILSVEEELIYNNSVGNEWDNWHSVRYNGEKYYCSPGRSITIPYYLGDTIEIHSYVEESDSYPDIAYHSNWDSFSADEARDGVYRGWTHTLTVVEDRGRYAGNSAQWEVSFIFEIDPEPTPRPSPTSTPYVWTTRTPKPNVPLSEIQTSPQKIVGTTQIEPNSNKTNNGVYWIYFFAGIIVICIIARVTTLVRETKESREERKQLKADNKRIESEINSIIKTLNIYDKLDVLEYLEYLYKK